MKKFRYLFIFFLVISLIIIPETSVKSNNTAELFVKAKNEYYSGNLLKSREIYHSILQNDKNNVKAIQNLIIINKELGESEIVVNYYRKLLALEQDNINYKYNYGIALYQSGDLKESKEILNNIIDKHKSAILANYEFSIIHYYLGKIFFKNGDFTEALKHYNKGIEYYSANVLNYLGKAEIFRRQDKYGDTLVEYNNALKKDNSLSYLYPEIALCYEKINNLTSAYTYWKKSVASGINVKLAREKMKSILSTYPGLDEEEERKVKTDVDWVEVELIDYDNEIPLLQIGLLDNITEFMFKSKTDFNIVHKNSNIFYGTGDDLWSIKYDGEYFLLSKNNEFVKKIRGEELVIDTEQFVIFNIPYGQGYFWADSENRQYRGKIELVVDESNKFSLINQISVEEYLFSVVPSEIPSWWPEEVLKAQSVAARTYALKNSRLNRHKLYDLCDEVHCAVYSGIKVENKKTKNAILVTKGEVITHNGELINAVFSSNSGGYSEDSKDIWGTEVAYLQGKVNLIEEKTEFPLTSFELDKWIKKQEKAKYYSRFSGSNIYRWIKKIPVIFLEEKYGLTSLKNIITAKRSEGGSVIEIIIKGKNKEITVTGDSIRSALGGLKSNRFIIEKSYSKEGNIKELIFYGSGWGHNVGMDQTAAAGMAEYGFNYKEILKHFYNNTEIKKIY